MSSDDNSKGKKRKWVILALLLVAFAIIAYITVSLLTGTGFVQLPGLFSARTPEITVDEYNFNVGRNRSFAGMGGYVASVGTLGVQVLDGEGRETLRDSFRMVRPAIVSSGARSIAFDIGGTSVRVFSPTIITTSLETDGRVVSASINRNGWFCIVTQDSGGFRGTVTVYNSLGIDVYRVNIGSGYAVSAHLSPDNKNLVIHSLIDNGSRITFYHGIDTEVEPAHAYDLYNELVIDLLYLPNGDVLTISTDSLSIIGSTGGRDEIYSFSDKRLGGYTFDGEFIALHIYDFGIGIQGRLVAIGTDGTILRELTTDWELLSMSSVGSSLVILKGDKLSFYNEELETFSVSAGGLSAAGANRVLAISEGVALATSDNSAVVLVQEEPLDE